MQLDPLLLSSLFLALFAISVLVFITSRKSRSQGNALLLVGPSDSGKTALFTSLVYDQSTPTHTSLQANSSFITIPGKKKAIKVIDIPGHPRIRGQFNDYLSEAKAILFVVDANTVSRNGALVAEHLHVVMDALMSLPPSHHMPALLVLAHKTDLLKASSASASADTTSLAVSRVQTVLERELEKRRASYSGGMGVETMGSEDEKSSLGGLECSGTDPTFKFANWDGGEVVFLGTSVKSSQSGDEKALSGSYSSLMDWIVEYV